MSDPLHADTDPGTPGPISAVEEILNTLPEDVREGAARVASDLHNYAYERFPTYLGALRYVARWPQYRPPVPPPPTRVEVVAQVLAQGRVTAGDVVAAADEADEVRAAGRRVLTAYDRWATFDETAGLAQAIRELRAALGQTWSPPER